MRPDNASSYYARSAGIETYASEYPRGRWLPRGPGNGASRLRPATFPRSLIFPIIILLMISISVPQSGSGRDLDAQLVVRLAGYGLAALAVLFAIGRRRLHHSLPILAWVLVPIFIAATALYAPQPSFSLTAGIAHLALLLFAWRMVHRHGQSNTVIILIVTGTIIGVLSIIAYYLLPDIGRSAAGTLTGGVGGRMQGVVAQPNSLGLISAFTMLLAVMQYQALIARQRLVALFAIAVAAFCVVYSDSRTSILALVLCLGMWGLRRANAALHLFGLVGIALIACLFIGFVPNVAEFLTREGSRTDDLTSFNGRSNIWSVAWEYIRDHPYLGQGYGSSGLILPTDDRLFSAAVNAHDVYLELLFSGGAALLILYAIAVSSSVVRSARGGRADALIALLFFLIVGVAEATPFSGLPLFSAAAFYIAISLCLARSESKKQAARSPAWQRPTHGGLLYDDGRISRSVRQR